MGLKVQILSDVHLDNGTKSFEDVVQPVGDVLCLLGDIGSPMRPQYADFIDHCAAHFQHVFVVAGNHEYYNASMPYTLPVSMADIDALIDQICATKHSNVTYLNKRTAVVDGVHFIGTTLWSWVPNELKPICSEHMTDYNLIYHRGALLTPDHSNQLFLENVLFLEKAIKDGMARGLPNVVLTHHTPSFQGTSPPKVANTFTQYAMSSPLDDALDSSRVKVWCCGRSHYNFRQVRNNSSLLLSNQYGYDRNSVLEGFQRDFHFTLEPPHAYLRL